MNKIGINEVLADLAEGNKCTLVYIRATGKDAGTKKTISNCMEGWNYTAFRRKKPLRNIHAINKKVIGKQKAKGLIPMIDLDKKQQLTLYISHIIGYNGKQVKH